MFIENEAQEDVEGGDQIGKERVEEQWSNKRRIFRNMRGNGGQGKKRAREMLALRRNLEEDRRKTSVEEKNCISEDKESKENDYPSRGSKNWQTLLEVRKFSVSG